MAGDWIKMRGGLFHSPKLIAMSHHLHADREFRDWLTPGGGGPMNGQVVSDHALRCVTGALLCVTWSWSRAFGKELPNGDCLLPSIIVSDLDGIAGAPSVGDAMEAVGWALASDDPPGVILPKFFADYNVPLTNAEKQKAYRERKQAKQSVTKALPSEGNESVTKIDQSRVEKSREEKSREEEKDAGVAAQRLCPERARGKAADHLTALIDAWNAVPALTGLPGLEQCRAPTTKRATSLKQRRADAWWREHWQEAVETLADSTFAQGGGDQGWRASLDWFLRPDTVAKILEGRYGERQTRHDPRGNLSVMETMFRKIDQEASENDHQ